MQSVRPLKLQLWCMENLILLVLCFGAGIAMRHWQLMPDHAPNALNTVILYLSLPAVTLIQVPQLSLEWALIFPALASWLLFLGAWLLFGWAGRRYFGLSLPVAGCLVLTCGLGNTSFVGFPLLQAYYGEAALQYGVLADQPGAFLVLATLGIGLATRFQGGRLSARESIGRVVRFPPFVAFMAGMLILLLPVELPTVARDVLQPLALTLTPLALLSVGLQLRLRPQGVPLKAVMAGLGYKLFLAPLMIALLFSPFLTPSGLLFKVSVVESAMAPMITAAIVASDHRLAPQLANSMVGLGIPLSLLTASVWYYILEWIS